MFCPNCGASAGESNFCAGCGAKMGTAQAGAAPMNNPLEETILWEGKPAGIGDKFKGALNSTRYKITSHRIIIYSGLITGQETDVEIMRIKDVSVQQSVAEKVAKVGDVTIVSTDVVDGTFVLNNVSEPYAVKEIIRKAMLAVRGQMNIMYREKV